MSNARDPYEIYPDYTRGERAADGSIHAIGILGALIGFGALALGFTGVVTAGLLFALLAYGLILIMAKSVSGLYHMTPWEDLRPLFRRMDHAVIFLMIAATYTPLVAIMGTPLAYSVLAIVWGLALYGAARRLFFWNAPGNLGFVIYLVIGWLGVALIWQMATLLPGAVFALIMAGAGLYSAGILFYIQKNMAYSNAIWHGFVLAAGTCFFFAIYLAANQVAA